MRLITLITACVLFIFSIFPRLVYATTYDLIAPTGQFNRGQDVVFTINIDTEGSSVKKTEIGMTYDTQYLQFVSATAGSAMSSVQTSDLGGGKLLLTGTNSSGFSGAGIFTTVTFRIIAQAPGSTQLCTLWAPTPTPTGAPIATSAPLPTSLPKTGEFTSALPGIIGAGLIGICGVLLFVSRQYTYSHIPKKNHLTHKKKI